MEVFFPFSMWIAKNIFNMDETSGFSKVQWCKIRDPRNPAGLQFKFTISVVIWGVPGFEKHQ